ncbi:MAG: hypothetical protein HQM08_00170 [Candidatus Riflebacteria bacterium]|nr:hypothetical protein [Candidatus Riflebacteria bacterium]
MNRGIKARISVLILIFCTFFASGCGKKNSVADDSQNVQQKLINLDGYIAIPQNVNEKLLARVLGAQSTDSMVKDSFSRAKILVNGNEVSGSEVITSAYPWEVQLHGVPESGNQVYRVEISSGKVGLKAVVEDKDKGSFYMDVRTTAAFLLADVSNIAARDIISTFTSAITPVANKIEELFKSADTGFENIFQLPLLQDEIERQRQFLAQNRTVNTKNKISYLTLENDLDGDGVNDFFVRPTTDGTRIRFECPLSTYSSMLDNIASLEGYSDAQLLQDFNSNNLLATRTFAVNSSNFALGYFFKRSIKSDLYLKIFVRRIDSSEGTLKGILSEYSFVTATGTSLVKGSKTFSLLGSAAASGTVISSDFLSDGSETDQKLVYLNRNLGLGSSDGKSLMLLAFSGKPALSGIESVPDHNRYPYFPTMQRAMLEISQERKFEVGDTFAAFFPKTGHYAIFSITAVNELTISVDYMANSSPGELQFKL